MLDHLPLPSLGLQNPHALLLLLVALPIFLIQLRSLRSLPAARGRVVLILRQVTVLLLVLALSEPVMAGAPNASAVAFLVDVSDSIPPQQQTIALNWVRQALAAKRSADEGQLIAFGGEPVIVKPEGQGKDLAGFGVPSEPNRTNVADAIRLALSTLSNDKARGIVILSDGAENAGDALQEAKLAAGASVPISFVPQPPADNPEVLVRQLESPSVLREQDVFELQVAVQSNTSTVATLYLSIDGKMDSSRQLHVSAGSNDFTIRQAPLARGFHSFEVTVDPQVDTLRQNNVGTGYSMVVGKAKVLIVEGQGGGGSYLAEAIRSGGIEVDSRAAAGLPSDPAKLRDFDSIVLVNVPANQLSGAQQQGIKTYVRSFGGGLVAVGGDRAYGVGGYAGTALEDILPVSMDIRGQSIRSSVAIIMVVDRSGSMSDGPPGASKMALAKKAAIESVGLLGHQDQVGVLAFEDSSQWIVRPTFVDDASTVQRQIGTLAPGGGTDIFPALREAYLAMSERDAKVRHLILMSDGLSPPGKYPDLMARMLEEDITLSTIAIGSDADFGLLKRLAEQGRGRYYEAIDPFDVPQLAVKETLEVSRAAVVEKDVRPLQAATSKALEGVDIEQAPWLAGYVATTAKPSSTSILLTDEQDPLLVEWQLGLGQVVAWTSDVQNRWATNWLNWPQFGQFWTQVVKRTISSQVDRNTQVAVVQAGADGRITVDTRDDAGNNVNLLRSTATVIGPGGRGDKVDLPQTAPGRYVGSFIASQEGVYSIAIEQVEPGEAGVRYTTSAGFVVSYSPEYRVLDGDSALLSKIAGVTGGASIADPSAVFRYSSAAHRTNVPLWPLLTETALIVFLCDIAIRRLRVGPSDLRVGIERVGKVWRERSQPVARPAATRLLAVKQRAVLMHTIARQPVQLSTSIVRPPAREAAGERQPAGTATLSMMSARLIEAKRRAGQRKD